MAKIFVSRLLLVGLIVVGALTILMSGVGLVMKNRLGGFWLGIIEQTGVPIDAAVRAQLQGTGGITALDIASMLFQLVLGALFLFSGIQMRKLVAWPLALTGAILAVVPCCSGCCCIGIPIGIWAIATLVRPEVKQSFN